MAATGQAIEETVPTKRKNRYRSLRKKKGRNGRLCRVCGRDPYPNYFYCPSCHHKVSGYTDGGDH